MNWTFNWYKGKWKIFDFRINKINANIDKDYKENLVKNTLGSGGEIYLDIIDKYGKHYEVRRLMGEQPSILDENGDEVKFLSIL